MIRTSPGRRLAAVAVLALALTWLTSPGAVPLYDGIAFPDEPYRYVNPPAGYVHTAPPTEAVGTSPASNGANDADLEILSAEQGPQVSVAVPAGSLAGSPSVRTLELAAAPLAPTGTAPPRPVNGNVYRVQAVGLPDGTTAMLHTGGGSVGEISLRASSPTGREVVIVYRPAADGSWRTLGTTRVGNDIYAARLPGLGEYALTISPRSAVATAPHGAPTGIIVLVVLFVGLAIALLGIRLSRMRAKA